MRFDDERNAFVLEDAETETLNASGGSVWPADEAITLLDIVESRIIRQLDLDPSDFPAGAYRSHVIERRQNNLQTLERIKSQLTPYVLGLEAEQFLNETTR